VNLTQAGAFYISGYLQSNCHELVLQLQQDSFFVMPVILQSGVHADDDVLILAATDTPYALDHVHEV
jgi:hypothetical protein